ncbi:CPBP family glutamic-type intramembrane protease [Spirosoma fluviale]|uniref:CAAX protease self-immunity n=1 Tax=Spirosoma fluviale TaxID=1597977 RepID=A0A286FZ78_9BACT|nr:CPBP family glutamic-type intramembrane protease [Spirosoma fluviale]SOD88074.1 CAAX protease self-immunity [Spirosoma fluviale]
METLQTTFADFRNYVRRPQYSQPLAEQPGNQLTMTTRHFLAGYPLVLGILLISIGNMLLALFTAGEVVFKPLLDRYSSSAGILLIALLIAVTLEEAIFRSILRLTPNRLRNLLALALWIPLGYYYHSLKGMSNEFALFWTMLPWAAVVYGLNHYLKRPAVFARIERFWQANFRWIFYSVGVVYGFMKIIDDVGTLKDAEVLLLPVFLLCSLLNGFYFGYIRMKYGFWYGVAVHVLVLLAALAPEAIRIL